jgi:hypothetical protein
MHIFKNYLIPRFVFKSSFQDKTQIEKKGNVKDTPLQFQDIYLINKFKNNLNEFEDLLQFLDNESLDLAKSHIDNIINSLSLRLGNNQENDNLVKENSFKIKYSDFVEEVSYYSVEKKNKTLIKDKYDLELKITKFKVHLGE